MKMAALPSLPSSRDATHQSLCAAVDAPLISLTEAYSLCSACKFRISLSDDSPVDNNRCRFEKNATQMAAISWQLACALRTHRRFSLHVVRQRLQKRQNVGVDREVAQDDVAVHVEASAVAVHSAFVGLGGEAAAVVQPEVAHDAAEKDEVRLPCAVRLLVAK